MDELVKAAKELLLSISMDMVNRARDYEAWDATETEDVVKAWETLRQTLGRHEGR